MKFASDSRLCRVTSILCLCLGLALSATASAAAVSPEPGSSATPQAAHWDVYLSGHAWHSRDSYTRAQLDKLNENAWGGGLGRTWRNGRGNDESIYLTGIRDSNNRPQWMAGYAYQWMFPVVSNKFEVGAGLTGLLIRRHDWYDGRPFPAILPVASIGTPNAQLVATYVPHLSMRKAKGNIVLLMLRMSL